MGLWVVVVVVVKVSFRKYPLSSRYEVQLHPPQDYTIIQQKLSKYLIALLSSILFTLTLKNFSNHFNQLLGWLEKMFSYENYSSRQNLPEE